MAPDKTAVMHAAHSKYVEKFKYNSFMVSLDYLRFLLFFSNSSSVANKVKANIGLSSLCSLHLFQIFFFFGLSAVILERWERKKKRHKE